MIELKKYYNNRVNNLKPNEHMLQVGHSINGVGITQQDLNCIVTDVIKGLSLSLNDNLLDLCCGNGVITQQLSKYCQTICAMDISNELIAIAKKSYSTSNIEYKTKDVYYLSEYIDKKQNINKVVMFAALQHFKQSDFTALLKSILSICGSNTKIFFGFVTDNEYKWSFHNTLKKKSCYFYRKILNTDMMGTWWDKGFIKKVCGSLNLSCSFQQLESGRYGYPYRFHCTIYRGETD